MARIAGIAVLMMVLASGLLGVAQSVVEGPFHMHALAVVGQDSCAVAQGRSVEIRSWAAPDRATRSFTGARAVVVSLAVSPDGDLIAAGDMDGNLTVWEIASGSLVFRKYAHTFRIWTLAFSPDGTLLATAGYEGTVRLWERSTWLEVGIFSDPGLTCSQREGCAHSGIVRCVAFSPDSKTLATVGCDGYIGIYDVDTLRLRLPRIQTWTNVYSVVFSPDGMRFAVAKYGGEIRVYRTTTWEEEMRFQTTSSLYVLAFSPDGARLFSGGFPKRLQVWDLGTRALVSEHGGHTRSIWGIAVLPDGERIVTTCGEFGDGEAGELRLWRIPR